MEIKIKRQRKKEHESIEVFIYGNILTRVKSANIIIVDLVYS